MEEIIYSRVKYNESTENETSNKYPVHSEVLCSLLDNLGYTDAMNKFRREEYERMANEATVWFKGERTAYIVGSKGEGIVNSIQSDYDVLHFYNSVVCLDKATVSNVADDIDVLVADSHHCYPGYVTIKRKPGFQYRPNFPFADPLYWTDHGFSGCLLKEPILLHNMESASTFHPIFSDIKSSKLSPGPATELESNEFIKYDLVFSIKYLYPLQLRAFRKRVRKYGWPPRNVLEEVVKMDAYLVAVGSKVSGVGDLEWRLCFNKSEILLLSSLRDCYTKLYILLKMIAKQILKPIGKEITSFKLKNIVFWMAELLPAERSTPQSFWTLVSLALEILKQAIINNILPYYMIPDRNLIEIEASDEVQFRMVRRIDFILQTGPVACLKCPKIYEALEMTPVELYQHRILRDQIEVLYMIIKTIHIWLTCTTGSVGNGLMETIRDKIGGPCFWRIVFLLYYPEQLPNDNMLILERFATELPQILG